MLINLRNALMAGKRLPYDAEVEYLESTGTQWINIYTFTGDETSLRYNIDFVITQNSSSSQSFVLGVSSNGFIGPRLIKLGNYFYYSCDSYNAAMGQSAQFNQRYDIDFTYNSDGTIESSINGGAISTYQRVFYSSPGGFNYLFGAIGDSRYGMIGRIYRMKMWVDSILVRDYIPVRKGTVGYLYDRVSGKLFGNAGTGDFVLGPDVVPVEYIESFRGSGGGQYINTGIPATTSTKWEIDIAFTTTTTGQLMGGGYSGSQRFNIGIESSAFRGGFGGGWFTISNTRDTNRHLWRLESLSAAQCEASIDGGAAVSYTSTFSPYSGPILLGRRYATESMTNGARYYGNKIWISGDLVQNLLPVRVGTEGAMMDVLTRRIYRNAGTGAFTYGNDLKYPIPSE